MWFSLCNCCRKTDIVAMPPSAFIVVWRAWPPLIGQSHIGCQIPKSDLAYDMIHQMGKCSKCWFSVKHHMSPALYQLDHMATIYCIYNILYTIYYILYTIYYILTNIYLCIPCIGRLIPPLLGEIRWIGSRIQISTSYFVEMEPYNKFTFVDQCWIK